MRIQSPLSNLCDVLVHVRSSATRYEATLRKNEAATRAVLIDPILRALGWDTSNTYMVEVEKTLSQTRVDYALYNQSSDVKVIIEAKPLGEDLNHPRTCYVLSTMKATNRCNNSTAKAKKCNPAKVSGKRS